jgi:hypothetical protein
MWVVLSEGREECEWNEVYDVRQAGNRQQLEAAGLDRAERRSIASSTIIYLVPITYTSPTFTYIAPTYAR